MDGIVQTISSSFILARAEDADVMRAMMMSFGRAWSPSYSSKSSAGLARPIPSDPVQLQQEPINSMDALNFLVAQTTAISNTMRLPSVRPAYHSRYTIDVVFGPSHEARSRPANAMIRTPEIQHISLILAGLGPQCLTLRDGRAERFDLDFMHLSLFPVKLRQDQSI
ncbi:hypothetical protein EJ05DRAFT_503474 [Pseudovirgaria hyperparasitica]|uniref:Uncharacterized protein n=1 Tax=Pseudovirgaria hyperparasitica TaxID=470096 RepID=A0A6A6W0R8_9PEZI|nr:uncharacterized protein EJ05DRAFT_503474 [Pseudovirgaria hyperparasitica]KAF2755167.1 hypothetical protein EJ05DRAFT_503474 [Pseudovirgaria hyperparasitica]